MSNHQLEAKTHTCCLMFFIIYFIIQAEFFRKGKLFHKPTPVDFTLKAPLRYTGPQADLCFDVSIFTWNDSWNRGFV